MRSDQIQTNFTGGEVSPLMLGRVDIDRYQNGAKQLRNLIVRPQGGVVRRPGTYYVGETKDSVTHTDRKVKLIPFIFNVTQSYVLELGHNYVRFYRDGARIESPPGTPVELSTPWGVTDLDRVNYVQSADTLYLVHPSYAPRVITRLSDTSWAINTFTTKDGPYKSSNNPNEITLTVSGYTNTATITSSTAAFTYPDPGGGATQIGKFIEFKEDDFWRLGVITAVTSTTVVQIDYLTNIVLGTDLSDYTSAGTTLVNTPTRPTPGSSINYVSTLNLIRSDHADTFTKYDVGKYIRANSSDSSRTGSTQAYDTNWYAIKAMYGTYVGYGQECLTGSGGAVTLLSTAGKQLTISNHQRPCTVTASTATFASTDVGRKLRLSFNGGVTWGTITGYTSSTVVSVSLQEDAPLSTDLNPTLDGTNKFFTTANSLTLPNYGITKDWKLGAWSDTGGYPGLVTFHDQRLTFARTNDEPQTFWMSRTEDYVNFAPTELDSTVLDTSAVTFTLASTQSNELTWMSSGKVLLLGSIAEEWQVRSGSDNAKSITPTSIRVSSESSFGSKVGVRSSKVQSSVMFMQRSGDKVREMVYDFSSDRFVSDDLTIVSDHIIREGTGAVDLAYVQDPYSILWVVRSDGKLAGLTYEKKQQVFAWHLHELAGTSAKVESICVVPDPNTGRDVLYMMVSRTIGAYKRRYIERMMPTFYSANGTTSDSGAFFVDCGLSGGAGTTFSGLGHLEGQTVGAVADGVYAGTFTVTSGQITLSVAATSWVHIGLVSTAKLDTLAMEGGNQLGTAQGQKRRSHRIVLRLYQSIDFEHGPSESNLTPVSFTDINGNTAMFTGDRDFRPDLGYEQDGAISIRQSKPYPLTLLAVVYNLKVQEQL